MQTQFHGSGNLSHYAAVLAVSLALCSAGGHSFAQDLSNEGQNNPTKGALSRSCQLTITSETTKVTIDVTVKPLMKAKDIKSGRVLYDFGIDETFQPIRLAVDKDISADFTKSLTQCVRHNGPPGLVLDKEWSTSAPKPQSCTKSFWNNCKSPT